MKTSFKVLTVFLSLAVPAAANAQSSRWKMAEERDRMTDEMSYLAMTRARDSSQFVIQCTTDYIAAFVKLQYLDMDIRDERNVRYRFDRDEPQESTWRNVKRGGGAVIFGDEAVEIARRAVTAQRLVVDNGKATVEFSLDGAGKALKQVAEKCSNLTIEQ
jgi:hypothetical protein